MKVLISIAYLFLSMSIVPAIAQDLPVELSCTESMSSQDDVWEILIPVEEWVDRLHVADLCDDFYVVFEELNDCIRNREYAKAISIANYCIYLSIKNGDTLQLVQANRLKASALRRSGKLHTANSIYKATIRLSELRGYLDGENIIE